MKKIGLLLSVIMLLSLQAQALTAASVACKIERGNSKTTSPVSKMTRYLSNGTHYYVQGDLKGWAQVQNNRLIQVAISDEKTFAFTQENPQAIETQKTGKSFLQSMSSGDYLALECRQL